MKETLTFQVVLMDKRNYILDYKDFKPKLYLNDVHLLQNFVTDGLEDDKVHKVEITKWKK